MGANAWLQRLVLLAVLALLWSPLSTGVPAALPHPVRVGAYQNAPLIAIDSEGVAQGVYPDLLNAIAVNEDWHLEYIPCEFAECLGMLGRGELDLMTAIAYSDARSQMYDFSSQTVLVNWGQLYTRSGITVDSILDLSGQRVAGVVDDIYTIGLQQDVMEFGVTCEFTEAPDYTGVFHAIASGQAEAGITSRLFGAKNASSFDVVRSSYVCCPVELRFAAPLGTDRVLLERIDLHLAKWKSDPNSEYHDIVARALNASAPHTLPTWSVYAFAGAGGLLLLLLGGAWILRLQVRARTRALVDEVALRQRAEEAERTQRLLAEALAETSSALSGVLTLEEALDLILAEADRVFPHDAGTFLLLDKFEGAGNAEADQPIARVVRSRGYGERGLSHEVSTVSFPLAAAPNLSEMLRTGQPYIVSDTRTYDGWLRLPATEWIRSSAGAPIRVKGKIIGFLSLDSKISGYFSETQTRGLQAFADQAGAAIEKAQLYDQIRDHSAVLELRVASRTAELQQANDSLRTSAEKLLELDRMKSEFVSNVSHELRTPLTNIKSYLYLLNHGKVERRDQYLRTLEREADLLQRIIEDLLHLSRLDLGKVAPRIRTVDLNDLISTLGGDRTLLLKERGLEIAFDLQLGQPRIDTDSSMVNQILASFLNNAMHFTQPGGKVTLFSGQCRENGGDWVFCGIRDTGPGIPADELPHIFERFYRGVAARSGSVPGTGLGLPICLELASRLGGTIKVESVVNKGSEFSLWLPVADAQSDHLADPEK